MNVKMPSGKIRQFSNDHYHNWLLHEEIANSITHGIGVLLGMAALILLIVNASLHGTARNIIGGSIFGVSLIISYLSSMLYHAILYPPLKRIFKMLDHVCIYILIAGTYTPITLVTLHGPFGWTLFGLIWGFAILGILFKLFFIERFLLISTFIYIAMGWTALIAVVPLFHHLPSMGIVWLVIGGIAYTLGTIFFILERIPFFHTIWHFFVLAGSICHFFVILFYVMPVNIFQ